MTRNPPDAVKRLLRQEVGFACPFPGCGAAILTLHHFDPPWHQRPHHRPEGMIALCRKHHAAADDGAYTKQELRDFKHRSQSPSLVRHRFPWYEKSLLCRVGGCWMLQEGPMVSFDGEPVIHQTRGPEGRVLLSAVIRKSDGKLAATLDKNLLTTYRESIYDVRLMTSGNRVHLWLAPYKVGLHLTLYHMTEDQLEDKLLKDHAKSTVALRKLLAAFPATSADCDHDANPRGPNNNIDYMLNLAKQRCLDSDQLIPVLDVDTLVTYSSTGRRLAIKNGIKARVEVHFSVFVDNGAGGLAL